MSLDFTNLARHMLDEFSEYVTELINNYSESLNVILTQEKVFTIAAAQRIKSNLTTTIGTLVNYTTNAMVQSQAQMNGVVDTFGNLMGQVVGNFRNLTDGYTAQLRAGVAEKIEGVLQSSSSVRVSSMQQFAVMQQLGMLNFSRTPWDPIGLDDCKFLGALCASYVLMGGATFNHYTLALATGRSYFCTPSSSSMSVRSSNGSLYNEDLVTWVFSNNALLSSPQPVYQRCLSEPPDAVQRVGQSCSPSQSCQCGDDQRCTPWYQHRLAVPTPDVLHDNSTLGPNGTLISSSSLPLLNASAAVPQVLGVLSGVDVEYAIDFFLNTLGVSPTTVLAIFFNDAQFSVFGSLSRKCAANETAPGDPSLPIFSALRVCDPGLRWAAQYIAANRLTMPAWATVLNDGVVWDIFTVPGLISYYVVIGTLLSEINAAVDATNAQATSSLNDVRAQQLSEVAASGAAATAYMAAVGAQNIAATQAMQDNYLAQISIQNEYFRAALNASQQQSTAQVQQLAIQQNRNIDAVRAEHLAVMSTTAGWTIAVVCAILLCVLLASTWGTVHITHKLNNIIALMEDVADMKVEDLEVPQDSSVQEVARIQTAFRVLIARLAEYKSYIPAGLFEQREGMAERPEKEESCFGGLDREIGDRGSASGAACVTDPHTPTGLSCKARSCPRQTSGSSATAQPGAGSSCVNAKVARRNVAVLCIKVAGFTDVLNHPNEGIAKSVFDDHVTIVHEAVSLARGNIDCIVGDQTFVTFNAHIPCGDIAMAAVNAALEVKNKFIPKLGDRLKFQIGISSGHAFASSVGYAKFKSMVTFGSPMKVAGMLSRLPQFDSGTILLDSATQERLKFLFKLIPVELVHIPNMKSVIKAVPKSQPVFAVYEKKDLNEGEWMYQIQDGEVEGTAAMMDWPRTFQELVATTSVPEGLDVLEKYLTTHPKDDVALRLRDRFPLWVPGLGIPQ
eukprot:EG_transcript_2048